MKIIKEKEFKEKINGEEKRINKGNKENYRNLNNDFSYNPNDTKNKSSNNINYNLAINKGEELNSLNKSIIEGNKSINSSSLDLVPGISKKINKNQTKNKIIEFPPVSFNSLVDNTISLNEENKRFGKNE